MRIRPLGKQVLVELESIPARSAGGLYIPDTAREHHMNRPDKRWGKVLAVGTRVREVREGQHVLVNAWVTDSARTGEPGARDSVVFASEDDIVLVEEE